MPIEALITIASRYSVKQTVDRLEAAATARGLQTFARIDHAAGARAAGMTLRPTELLIFGHAKGGTPLMQLRQTIGIDLPLRMLAWEDQDGKVWLAYDAPAALVERHHVPGDAAPVARALTQALEELAAQAVA